MINEILIKNNCFMAHCFTMENNKYNFYERLDYCIINSSEYELIRQ